MHPRRVDRSGIRAEVLVESGAGKVEARPSVHRGRTVSKLRLALAGTSPWLRFRTLAVAGTLAGFSSGCIVSECETADGGEGVCLETPHRFDGFATTDAVDYTWGYAVEVDGIYGDIVVVEGVPGEVGVTYAPFAYAARDDEADAVQAALDKPELELTIEGDTIVVRTARADGDLPLVGVDLEITLPPEFDGPLVVRNRGRGTWNPGDIDIEFVGDAPSVEVTAKALSNCDIIGGPNVTYTYAHCGDTVRVRDVHDTVDLRSTGGFGDVQLQLASISPFTEDSVVYSEDGDVQVEFPDADSFSFMAQAGSRGFVDLGSVEGYCEVAVAADSAKSATCGDGGPLYELVAEDGDVFTSLR